jgi:enoyl-CoA hydratase/carnithine racemase
VVLIVTGVVWFFHVLLNWLLVDKVVVLEGEGWRSALRRSKELMKTRTEPGFWKRPKNKAGLILVLGFLIGVGIHLLFQTPGLIMHWLMPASTMGQTIQQILNVVATSLATVFTAIAMILYYYDIRLRSEGFDLKMMAKHL